MCVPPPPTQTHLPSPFPLPQDLQRAAADVFAHRHPTTRHSQQWGNLTYFRMTRIADIYFVGGFGTVQVRGAGRPPFFPFINVPSSVVKSG